VQRLQSVRRQILEHQLRTYQLSAVILHHLNVTQQLNEPTHRRLKSLESRRKDNVGIYSVLCKLQKIIMSLELQAGNTTSAESTCVDHSEQDSERVNRIISKLTTERNGGPRVKAKYIAAVLSVSVRHLLSRRSAINVTCPHADRP